MKRKFTKMHGTGNDFVVFDATAEPLCLTPALARRIADRHFGIGCDQILVVERSDSGDADFRYRIFNADGGEVEQCGNGARCFVRFVHEHGLTRKTEIRVRTLSGLIVPRLEPDGEVTVDMGSPVFDPARIPFVAPAAGPMVRIEVEGEPVSIAALSMGNPHAVQLVADVDAAPVQSQGPLIERHPCFPKRVNAGYMQLVDAQTVKLRVWERGAGETLACGTGACAAAVAGMRMGLLRSPVWVAMRGGRVKIAWSGSGNDLNCKVFMTGPAVTVFEGEIQLDGCCDGC